MLCAECGCQLTASRKKGVYDYYYCTNGKGHCSQHLSYLTDSIATDFFVSALEKIQFHPELVEIMYEAKLERLQNDQIDTEKVLADIELEMSTWMSPIYVLGCQTWTRTKITSSRGMRPTIRRSGSSANK